MQSGYKYSALFVVILALASTVYTIAAGNQPLLGLDLQGGVSVVLQPTGEVEPEALDQSLEIIRSRVDALGVAEPEISRQGETIVVDLPGVQEQQRAVALVGQTAELRFRPVLFDVGPVAGLDLAITDGVIDGGDDTDSVTSTTVTDESDDATTDDDESDEDGSTATDDDASTTTDDDDGSTTTTEADASDEESFRYVGGRLAPVALDLTGLAGTEESTTTTTDDDATTTTDDDDGSTTTSDDDDGSTTTTSESAVVGDSEDDEPAADEGAPLDGGALDSLQLAIIEVCGSGELTAPEDDVADQPVLLASRDGIALCLGPTLLTGDALEDAGIALGQTGQWTVNPVFKSGPDGIDAFNQGAALCYAANPDPNICPSGRLAIVLDHEVVSSPSINAPTFARDQITISGDFLEEDARDLASVLRFGALPVELETQQVRTVSATIGDDVLRAGIISGLIGLAVVAVYLLAYYRLAGLVALAGLGLSSALLWSIIAWFGTSRGLALTLAGVVGLIVSIGVSADSNIVYFENVKDAYRGGRKVTTSVERAYQSAISTIIKADVVSLIAAALLYWLTVGAVRGFAFYLGLATLLDLFISWLFMRPALMFLAKRGAVTKKPILLGLPVGGTS